MVIILILKVIVIIIIIITIIIFIIIIGIIIIILITWCLEINMHVKIFEHTKAVQKKHEPQAFRLSFPTKLIEIDNFTFRINQPLLVESKAFDWYIFSLYNVVYCEIIDWLKSLRESELWPVCWYCKMSSISSSHRYVQSNLAISNSVNSKSPLFRRKIECPRIYPSPLRFPGYFEAPLFRTFFHFPWDFEIAGFDCICHGLLSNIIWL